MLRPNKWAELLSSVMENFNFSCKNDIIHILRNLIGVVT